MPIGELSDAGAPGISFLPVDWPEGISQETVACLIDDCRTRLYVVWPNQLIQQVASLIPSKEPSPKLLPQVAHLGCLWLLRSLKRAQVISPPPQIKVGIFRFDETVAKPQPYAIYSYAKHGQRTWAYELHAQDLGVSSP